MLKNVILSPYQATSKQVISHQFNWWFDISPPKGYVTARPKGRYRKHFTGPL